MHRTVSTIALPLCLVLSFVCAPSESFAAKVDATTPKPGTPPKPAKPSSSAPSPERRAASWKKDVQFLATELPRVYPEVFTEAKRRAWDDEAKRIQDGVAKMSDAEVKVALLRMVASLGDRATKLQWSGERFFTMAVQSFPDGIRVLRAQQGLDRAVGARLTKVGETPLDEAAKRLAPLSGCGDDECRKDTLARQVTSAEILRVLHLVPEEGAARFGFVDSDGEFTLEIPAKQATETNIGMWASAIDSSVEKIPLYLRNREENYWYELLPETNTLYVQYSRSRAVAGSPMSAFTDEVFRAIEGKNAERLVIDLRRNTATDAAFLAPLLAGIEKQPALQGSGKLFVIVGPLTYPAGAENARELARRFHATIVGETVPARGRTTGEARAVMLPESRLRVTYPVLAPAGAAEAKALVPDVAAEATFDSLKEGKDAAMEAILARSSKRAAADAAK